MKKYIGIFLVLFVFSCSDSKTEEIELTKANEVKVGFSPEGTALSVVLNTIDSAKVSINMMGYSFTSPTIVKHLISAKKRGVVIKIVLDYKGNKGKSSIAAMNLLKQAGISLRTDDAYAIQHDKVIIADDETVQTGSFNYSSAADKRNSENVISIKHKGLAKAYNEHFLDRWSKGKEYKLSY